MTDSDDLGHSAGDDLATTPDRGEGAAGKARRAASQTYSQATALAERGYDRARSLAGQAPDTLSEQIRRAPFTSVLLAALLGVATGWALRGSVDR